MSIIFNRALISLNKDDETERERDLMNLYNIYVHWPLFKQVLNCFIFQNCFIFKYIRILLKNLNIATDSFNYHFKSDHYFNKSFK